MPPDSPNQREWNNPQNWSRFTYRSRLDTRVIVPKRSRLGWTINFGHPKAVLWFASLLALPLLILALIRLTASH